MNIPPPSIDKVIEEWREAVLKVLLPVLTIAFLPALVHLIIQTLLGEHESYATGIYILFYLALLYLTFSHSFSTLQRAKGLLTLNYMMAVFSLGRSGLAGDGRLYLMSLPLLATVLVGTETAIYTSVLALVTFAIFAYLADKGMLVNWLVHPANPHDLETWVYSGLTLGAILLTVVIVIVRFTNSYLQALRESQQYAAKLDEAYRQLEASHQNLEQKVQQRTQGLMRTNRHLEFLATHDSLTGLPNRLLFYDRLEQAIRTGERFQQQFAILFVDLDNFKQVNDIFGHPVGDVVLKEIGRLITSSLRESDTVARLAGDEFAIILDHIRTPEDALCLAENIRQHIGRNLTVLDHTINMTASIGISLFPRDGVDAQTLLRKADEAMYRAKIDGKDRCVLANEYQIEHQEKGEQ